MSDLNIVRLGSLQEDDDEPSHDGHQSYNSWRYADEASLYSIAEDSREEQLSSQATDSRMSSSQQNNNSAYNNGARNNNIPVDGSPIEVRWVTSEEMQFEAAETGGEPQQYYSGGPRSADMAIPIPGRDPEEIASQEEDEVGEALGPRHNTRRTALYFLMLLCAVVVIILSLTLALGNRGDSKPAARVSGGLQDPDYQGPQIDPGEAASAAATPTQPNPTQPSPTAPAPPVTIDPFELVKDALLTCPQTTEADLTNPDTMQMEVFHIIAYEVKGLITTNANGSDSLDPRVGTNWILEKWGLLMLFFATPGEHWDDRGRWYSTVDTCSWYNEAQPHCIGSRENGGAAVTKLKLGTFAFVHLFIFLCWREMRQ